MYKTIIISTLILSGCSVTTTNPYFDFADDTGVVFLADQDSRQRSEATGVVWNSDYIVTVKHYPMLKKACISSSFDLAFIKTPSLQSNIPKWTHAKTGDTIIMKGYIHNPQSNKPIYHSVDGKLIYSDFNYRGSYQYKAVETSSDNTLLIGMSGGPAFNSSGNIIGINIGFTNQSVKAFNFNPNKRYSIILPYSAIQKGWEEVQFQIKSGQCG